MATDNYKEVYWNDGEGITHGDLNDGQRYLLAKIYDQMFTQPIGSLLASGGGTDHEFGAQNATEVATTHAYCLSPGRAYLRKGTAVNKIQIAPGTLLQKLAASDGNDPQLLAFTFVGTEEVTIADGDATNPRVDLIQMKLEMVTGSAESRDFKDATTGAITSTSMDKKRRVQCTLSVKAGTPAASPTHPDPDAGYVAVGAVVVNATYTSGGAASYGIVLNDSNSNTTLTLFDHRMPISIKRHTVYAHDFVYDPSGWTYNHGTHTIVGQATPTDLFIPYSGPFGRLIGVTYVKPVFAVGTSNMKIGIGDFSTVSKLFNHASTYGQTAITWQEIAAGHDPISGPVVQDSATAKLGPPIWTSGQRAAYPPDQRAAEFGSGDPWVYNCELFVEASESSTSDEWFSVTFYVAEGI